MKRDENCTVILMSDEVSHNNSDDTNDPGVDNEWVLGL